MRLVVHPLAVREIHKAADRYRRVSLRVEYRFAHNVVDAFQRIREYPEIGVMLDCGERRLMLQRFPYKVIYHPELRTVFVVALAHHRRRQGYWRRRWRPRYA